MDAATPFLFAAIIFGLSSGISPGPTLALTVSETLAYGPRAGLKVASAPLITDGPIICFSWLFLVGMGDSDWVLGLIAFAGSVVLLFFARECLSIQPVSLEVHATQERAWRKGVLANILNPAPYLFWVAVGTPTLQEAHEKGGLVSGVFLCAFFISLIGSKAVIAIVTAQFRDFLRGRPYLWVMRMMGLILVLFALVFLRRAWVYWIH